MRLGCVFGRMPSVADLILGARQKSNTERSKFVSDTEVLGYINERLQSLRDEMIEADPSFYHSQADLVFNNPAGYPAGSATLPADLYRIRGLTQWPDTPNARSIRPLAFSSRDGARDAGYVLDGNCVTIVPYQEATRGPVRVYYTPVLQILASPVSVDTTPQTVNLPNAGSATMGFSPGAFLINDVVPANVFRAADVGQTVTIAGSVSNNGTFVIDTVFNGNSVALDGSHTSESFPDDATAVLTRRAQVDAATGTWYAAGFGSSTQKPGDTLKCAGSSSNDGQYTILTVGDGFVTTATAGLTSEVFATATLTTQPAGTTPTLDFIMNAYAAYLTIGAALTIATKMQKDSLVALLTQQFAAEAARVSEMAANRAGETEAIPVLWRPETSPLNPWGWGGWGF